MCTRVCVHACMCRNIIMILAWRLKTVQRNIYIGFCGCSRPNFQDSPTTQWQSLLIGEQLLGEECREALSTIKHLKRRWEPPLSTDKSCFMTRIQHLQSWMSSLVSLTYQDFHVSCKVAFIFQEQSHRKMPESSFKSFVLRICGQLLTLRLKMTDKYGQCFCIQNIL